MLSTIATYDYEFRKESKRRHESIDKNSAVKIQMQQLTVICRRKFAAATLLKKEGKTVKITVIKKERCFFL
jgi:hypothetical protein